MKFKDYSIPDQMDFCARWLLIHSILYYELDKNMVSDSDYDSKLKWLCSYSLKHPTETDQCYYSNLIHKLDPCSGFYMKDYITPEHYNYLCHLASHIYQLSLKKGDQ